MHHDLHAIDKDIAAAALKEAGHRVIDLGVDVRPAEFLERAEETGARIVIVFAQMIGDRRVASSRVREMFRAGGRDDVVMLRRVAGRSSADVALARGGRRQRRRRAAPRARSSSSRPRARKPREASA